MLEQIQNLEQTLRSIESIQNKLTPEQLTSISLDKGRTPLEILAHIRSCADLWSYSIYAMLASKEEPVLAQLNAHQWTATLDYANKPFSPSFHTFKANRIELLHVLRGLPEELWQKTAIIGGRQHTVYSQARRMALHEISHCKELASIARLHG